jgi:putative oxidoreductase
MLLMQGPADTALYFASLGVPFASITVWFVIAVKVLAGLAIILGYRVGLASAALIAFTAATTITAHSNFSDPMQLTAALKNLAIIGGLLYLMAYGPGGSNTTELSTK